MSSQDTDVRYFLRSRAIPSQDTRVNRLDVKDMLGQIATLIETVGEWALEHPEVIDAQTKYGFECGLMQAYDELNSATAPTDQQRRFTSAFLQSVKGLVCMTEANAVLQDTASSRTYLSKTGNMVQNVEQLQLLLHLQGGGPAPGSPGIISVNTDHGSPPNSDTPSSADAPKENIRSDQGMSETLPSISSQRQNPPARRNAAKRGYGDSDA